MRKRVLPGKVMGKANVAKAEVVLEDGAEFAQDATSRVEGPLSDRPVPRSQGGYFEPTVDSISNRVMDTDAEYKVLSDLAAKLTNRYGQGARASLRGRLHLFTELSPCDSCALVIVEFEKMFPNIKVVVRWAMKYGG